MPEETKPVSQQSRVRRPMIQTKKQAQRPVVRDTKERQDGLQKQHAAEYKAQHPEAAKPEA